jgi:ABC-type phosphate/phosphonate transport system substrate-binding protein
MQRIALLIAGLLVFVGNRPSVSAEPPESLTLIVMDPLAGPLACDCVQGYAQRKYELLGNFLSEKLQRPVKVYWSDSLARAIEEKTSGKAHLVIGKHSVVLFDAKAAGRRFRPIASLTGQDGTTTQTGLIVVRTADPAQTVADLAGYRIFFGPEDCDEKSLAPLMLLQTHGIARPEPLETCAACSNAATKLVELDPGVKAAAVISSYAEPLLQGCGTVKKGDLRVVGVSDPVPFITAFVSDDLPQPEQAAIQAALLEVGTQAELLIGLETGSGFVEYQPVPTPGSSPSQTPAVSQAAGDAKKKN